MSKHVWSANLFLDNFMADPEGPKTLWMAREGIKDGRWGADYVDSIGQGPYSGWPMKQLAMFAVIHDMIYGGLVATVRIGTTGTPAPDAMREENAQTLSRLPRPFDAHVDMKQHMEEGDGTLRWDEPITVSLCTGLIDRDPDGTRPLSVSYQIPPGSAVLELGQSLASRTWKHLALDSGRVARWAYGHSVIWLFINHDFLAAKERMMAEFMKYRKPAA
jgi:hypothetical protein